MKVNISLKEEQKERLLREFDAQRMELELVESEDRYRTVMDYSNDGVTIVRGDNHIFVRPLSTTSQSWLA